MTQTVYEVANDLKLMANAEQEVERKATLLRAADRIVWEHERHMALQKLVFGDSQRNEVKERQ